MGRLLYVYLYLFIIVFVRQNISHLLDKNDLLVSCIEIHRITTYILVYVCIPVYFIYRSKTAPKNIGTACANIIGIKMSGFRIYIFYNYCSLVLTISIDYILSRTYNERATTAPN